MFLQGVKSGEYFLRRIGEMRGNMGSASVNVRGVSFPCGGMCEDGAVPAVFAVRYGLGRDGRVLSCGEICKLQLWKWQGKQG